jgi:hypothetical protein
MLFSFLVLAVMVFVKIGDGYLRQVKGRFGLLADRFVFIVMVFLNR